MPERHLKVVEPRHRPSATASTSRRSVLLGLGACALASVLPPAPSRAQGTASTGEIRIAHAFGEMVLPAPATRVVSLGYTTHDALLALGVVPVGIRYWFGDEPDGVFPWARDRLGEARPTLISGEISPETVAALQPDLIVGIGSGISQDEYALLSQIAPTLMHAEGEPVYGVPWDEMTLRLGRATGREALAQESVAALQARFAAVRDRYPDWAGRTAVPAYHFAGETGGFTRDDTRGRFLADLGFAAPPQIEELGAATFYAALSPEDLSAIDVDLLLWISSQEEMPDLVNLPMRRLLAAHAQGREVAATGLTAAALSFGSILSIPFALDALEADIALALDGDPATVVPSAAAAGLAP